ncbi:uncharacterized protein BYT42DRAFT_580421 [Radiomyces spectabilis]|uniref:uncharacterized protein n=1 Tax=Radiomyces spectabilis TaxID=64574 RepID=UPI00221EB8F6|nr:uncharacterized protein BYT42DRAFT_580421 [Radiomyces spectabilis]KAI8371485.1 hypothetical protein BYT42DRAFT_580421 [Radiomyces spectabilis]
MSVYDRDDFYATPGHRNHTATAGSPPPPVPHHVDSPAMRDTSFDNYPLHEQHYTPPPAAPGGYPPSPFQRQSLGDNGGMVGGYNQRASMSDMKLTGHYDSDDEDYMLEGGRVRVQKKRGCMDKVCCGCCTCCPRWARYCSCVCLLILVMIGIVVGVLAAIFKVPEVNFNGIQGEPQVNMTGSTMNLAFKFDIGVNNPNVESITFESIVAKAYYPGFHDLQIGGGQANDVHINSNGITNITFPFDLHVDTADDRYKGIITDLLGKCGLMGGEKQSIKVDYDIIPTVRIIGIAISPTISQSSTFPCPINSNDLSSLGGLSSMVPGLGGSDAGSGTDGAASALSSAASAAGL